MFDYNPKQKSIQGIYQLKNLEIGTQNWKINVLEEIGSTNSPQFIKKIDFDSLKTNPFLEIQQTNKKQTMFINDLDFSTISVKSPSYSQFYNSVGPERFFHAPPKNPREGIDSPRPQLNVFDRNTRQQLKQAINDAKYSNEVPTFFIKMPQHFRGEREKQKKQFQMKVKRELEGELQDIYNGKYKIIRQENKYS